MSFFSLIASLIAGISINTTDIPVTVASTTPVVQEVEKPEVSAGVPEVPLYSQFYDVDSPYWQKRACGVASLAMLIDFYNDKQVSVNNLIDRGVDLGAYIKGAGWSHNGLVRLSRKHGLGGGARDLSGLSNKKAFDKLKSILKKGPVIASVHYTFEPTNPIPHLAVINGVEDSAVYYNDPANDNPGTEISRSDFMEAWKKRIIVIRPQ